MDIAVTPPAEHPYAKELEKTLDTQRKMYGLLTNKVALLKQRAQDMSISELDRVNAEIETIRSEGELSVLDRVIRHKQKYFDSYMEQFAIDSKECDERLEKMLNVAARSKNPKVQRLMARDLQAVLNEPEAKVALYKQLKKHLNG